MKKRNYDLVINKSAWGIFIYTALTNRIVKQISYHLIVVVILITFSARPAAAQCIENFDGVTAPALPTSWTAVTLLDCASSNPWATSTTTPFNAPNSAFVNAPACTSDEVLISRTYAITSSSAQLTFGRKNDFENGWDGMVLEISFGGSPFEDILTAGGTFVAGGYTLTLNNSTNPIGGRQGWSGTTSGTFVTTTINLPASANGQIVVFRWRRGTDGSIGGTGAYIDNISSTGCALSIPCAENFDGVTAPAFPPGWVAFTGLDCANSNPWAIQNSVSNTVPNSAFVNDPDCVSDEYLTSRTFLISSAIAQLTFRRNNDLENTYDGLVLEISIGGAPFQDIILAGGVFVTGNYNAAINSSFENPIAGRQAWTGNSSGWVITTINLPAAANNQRIVLRWRRGTDISVSGVGAYIDGVTITGSTCNTVCPASIILTPPSDSLCSGSVVLTATGGGPAYQWYRNNTFINGITGNTYTATSDGGYHVKSVVAGCTVSSNEAIIKPGTITPSLGGNGVYCPADFVNVGIPMTYPDQTYTWFRQSTGLAVQGPLTGNGGNQSLQFTMNNTMIDRYYVVSGKTGCISATSNIVDVGSPIISNIYINSVCPTSVSFSWTNVAVLSVPQSYEYSVSTSSTPPASGISAPPNSATENGLLPGTVYYIHVRAACGPTLSSFGNWTTISFATQNELVLDPPSGVLCNGSVLLTAYEGVAPYIWRRNGIVINGVAGSTYTATLSGTYIVYSTVSGCNLVSNQVVIDDNVTPGLGGTGVYCEGESVNVGIPITEVGQNYTWKQNNLSVYGPIGGNGGNQSLQFAMTESRAGTYRVESTKPGCNVVYSNYVYVGFAKITGLTTTSVCSNLATVKWNRVVPVFVSQSYQYAISQSATPPASGTATSDSTTTFVVNPSTTYFVHVRSTCNFGSSFGNWNTISFTTPSTSPPPTTITPPSATVCTGNSQFLSVSGGTSYQWYRNGAIIGGATSQIYNAGQGGIYQARITNGGCVVFSSISTITEIAPPVAGTAEWSGAASTAWADAANWKCFQVPAITSEVIIDGGKPNYPLVTSTVTVRKLTLNAGASLNVSPGVVVIVTGQ